MANPEHLELLKRGRERPFFKSARNQPEVIAHRGGAGQWPGETLLAFERALEIGADVIEMDVHATSDGHLVLIHNPEVDATTDGRGPVSGFKLEELKKLDAGYRWTADGGKTFPFRGRGIQVSTLEEVFLRFPGRRMNIEIKQVEPERSIVRPLAAMINKHGMRDKVLVASFSHITLDEFRSACPGVATSASTNELIKFMSINSLSPGASTAGGADAVQIKSEFLLLPVITARTVRAAKRLGLPIHGWTVNRLGEMRRVINLGVDGIITDFPGPLLALLNRHVIN